MKNSTDYFGKKVLVVGLAKSGMSAARLLIQLGAIVTVNDKQNFTDNSAAQELLSEGITVVTGSHPIELLDENFTLIVKNPGIPYDNPLIAAALQRQIPIITEVELAYQISEAAIIGITGTNGKTTTTTLIGSILNEHYRHENKQAYLAGNIGIPASEVAQKATKDDTLVMELSSFQLMGIHSFRPKIAVLLNFYDAHLDYHGNREAYITAKWQIQKNMCADDFLVLNFDQLEMQILAQETKATVIPFSTHMFLSKGAYIKEDICYFQEEAIIPISELGVPGKHNVENALAAISIAKLAGCSTQTIRDTLKNFKGVEHRTQLVGEIQGRMFYNDSKATNIPATKVALSGFEKDKLILLAGGLDRGNEFDELISDLKGISTVILFGQTKEKLALTAQKADVENILFAENVAEATKLAYIHSQSGDVILLSPSCASWDQYPNYEIRGNEFVSVFKQLQNDEVGD